MKFDPEKQSAHAAVAAYTALYGAPLSDQERLAHRQRVAAEMARAEARRRAEPQLELPE